MPDFIKKFKVLKEELRAKQQGHKMLTMVDHDHRIYLTRNDDGSVLLSMKGRNRPYVFEFANDDEFLAVIDQFKIIREMFTED